MTRNAFGKHFPASLVAKESTCNAGDPNSIPGSSRSPGEGVGYPLQYSCASLVAQLAKNPPAVWETWVQFLGWEDPLEKGTAIHSSILAWKILYSPWGHKESDTTEQLALSLSFISAGMLKIIPSGSLSLSSTLLLP